VSFIIKSNPDILNEVLTRGSGPTYEYLVRMFE